MNQTPSTLVTTTLALVLTGPLLAQEKPFMQPGTSTPVGLVRAKPAPPKEASTNDGAATTNVTAAAAAPKPPPPAPGTLNSFFNGKLPAAIGQSKLSLNARLRYEMADQDSLVPAADLKTSHAFTLRTRFGLTTAPVYGFQGMLEGENITVLGPKGNYNAAGSNSSGAGKTVVADPATTELNQAWLAYTYTNLDLTVRGGRQRLALDNHRFVGDVGWRQNMQTFDAATLLVKPLPDLSVFYGYAWEVNRVFGDVDGLAPANRDFDSASHLINVSYDKWKYGRFVGYSYLLDLENDAGFANSAATYGAYFAGSAPVHENVQLGYRAEFAWQTDYADSPISYEAEYYNVEVGATIKPFAFGAGYEVLGTDDNNGFRTPLATLHAFNGWADVFLTTPGRGLRDLYAYAQMTLPADIPLRFIYHKFDADSQGADFGQEYDVVLTKKFGKHWAGLLKYGYYDGKDAPFAGAAVDVHKFWAQIEFNY